MTYWILIIIFLFYSMDFTFFGFSMIQFLLNLLNLFFTWFQVLIECSWQTFLNILRKRWKFFMIAFVKYVYWSFFNTFVYSSLLFFKPMFFLLHSEVFTCLFDWLDTALFKNILQTLFIINYSLVRDHWFFENFR